MFSFKEHRLSVVPGSGSPSTSSSVPNLLNNSPSVTSLTEGSGYTGITISTSDIPRATLKKDISFIDVRSHTRNSSRTSNAGQKSNFISSRKSQGDIIGIQSQNSLLRKEREKRALSQAAQLNSGVSFESTVSSQESKQSTVGIEGDLAAASDPFLFRQNQMFPSFFLVDPREKYVQVTVKWKDLTIRTQILLCWTIEEGLNEIVLDVTSRGNDPTTDISELRFMIGKVDRNCPGMQTWMQMDNYMYSYDIKQGVLIFLILG